MRFLLKFTVLLVFLLFCTSCTNTEAYDPLDPTGNITIKWDVMMWTSDGYVAVVTLSNYQLYRHIQSPGWSLGWTWAGKEVIWSMMGAQTTMQGDCSQFVGSIPHSCEKSPTVVDLLLGTPYNQQIANCCKGGVISSRLQDPANAASSFQITVGTAGTTNRTVKLPRNFTLAAPGPGYTCGSAKIVSSTKFITSSGKRYTQAMMTWTATCAYSPFLAQKTPPCCVSLSWFENDQIVSCPTCACGCHKNSTRCINQNSKHSASVVSRSWMNRYTPVVKCTSHMCPVTVHWHLKQNHEDYWRIKLTITNFNYNMNYTQWNLVAQHPNFDNISRIFGFHFKLIPHSATNDTAMFWGIKHYNDVLMQAGPQGHVEAELLFQKKKGKFNRKKGWSFPQRIYFNGDNCVMPTLGAINPLFEA